MRRLCRNCVVAFVLFWGMSGCAAASAAEFPTMTLPENWNADPEALLARVDPLFYGKYRATLRKMADYALSLKDDRSDDFLRWLALVEVAAKQPDARLFFLVEGLPEVLNAEPPYEYERWNAMLGELNFRVRLMLEGPDGDGVGDGAPNGWAFSAPSENESSLFLDRSPDPYNSVWKITWTARVLSADETAGSVSHEAADRFGEYPRVSFMRLQRGRILYTDPAPAYEDFFADPGNTSGPFHESRGDDSEDNPEEAAPEMRVLFESLASDDSRIGASLFQVNRDSYSPSPAFVAQCELRYEWDGERYRTTDKICKKDDEWGSWPYGSEDAPPR